MAGQTKGHTDPLIERLRAAMADHELGVEDVASGLHVGARTVYRWLSYTTAYPGTRRRQILAYLDTLDDKVAA